MNGHDLGDSEMELDVSESLENISVSCQLHNQHTEHRELGLTLHFALSESTC